MTTRRRRKKPQDENIMSASAMQGGHNKLSQKIVGSKFYCPHALADSNQCTQVREKTLQFFSVVLPVPSLYLHIMDAKKYKTEKSGN